MTTADKSVTRRTYSRARSAGKSRDIIVSINPTWLSFRLAGTRKVYLLDVEAAYVLAAKLEANRARAERLKERARLGSANEVRPDAAHHCLECASKRAHQEYPPWFAAKGEPSLTLVSRDPFPRRRIGHGRTPHPIHLPGL